MIMILNLTFNGNSNTALSKHVALSCLNAQMVKLTIETIDNSDPFYSSTLRLPPFYF